MKKILECPFCDGNATLIKYSKELIYRKESFDVVEHFYKCGSCNEEFTTTETDTITLLQAHNQYREKYSIPFPEQILSLRNRYCLSATKMSEVLGIGVNGYSNYEKGEIPTLAIANLISITENPETFKLMLIKAEHYFTPGMYSEALKQVQFLISKIKDKLFQISLNQYSEPCSLTGYKQPNKKFIANILVAYITKCTSDFNDRLKLNKLLFYTDFLNYKLFGTSITGLSYRAIQYGPVPTCYDNLYGQLENEGIIISDWTKNKDGSAREIFTTEAQYEPGILAVAERDIVELIVDNFKNMSSWDLVDLSHTEKGWIELHTKKEVINYQTYAFDLIGV